MPSIIVADIAGFTSWSSKRQPVEVFKLLETLYGHFDRIARRRKVFKVETIGDWYGLSFSRLFSVCTTIKMIAHPKHIIFSVFLLYSSDYSAMLLSPASLNLKMSTSSSCLNLPLTA